MKPRSLLATTITTTLLAAVVALSGCTGDDGDGTDDDGPGPGFVTPPTDGDGRYVIAVGDGGGLAFGPGKARVPVGATVVWTWESGVHDVEAVGGPFSSGAAGSITEESPTFEYTFGAGETGLFDYYCKLHTRGAMSAQIYVG